MTKPAFVLTSLNCSVPLAEVYQQVFIGHCGQLLCLFWQVFGGGGMLYARWALRNIVSFSLQYTSSTEMTAERVEGVYGILTGVSIRDKWL